MRQPSGTNRDLYGVSFTDANTGTAVGGYGAILRTTELGPTPTPTLPPRPTPGATAPPHPTPPPRPGPVRYRPLSSAEPLTAFPLQITING